MYPATFLITVLVAHVNAIVPAHNSGKGLRPWLQTGPPRFKQNQRVVHEVFLNDKAIFKCTALARPAPKVAHAQAGATKNKRIILMTRASL
ncbi:unnamed protein product, partial [Wuchereria bancrofti]